MSELGSRRGVGERPSHVCVPIWLGSLVVSQRRSWSLPLFARIFATTPRSSCSVRDVGHRWQRASLSKALGNSSQLAPTARSFWLWGTRAVGIAREHGCVRTGDQSSRWLRRLSRVRCSSVSLPCARVWEWKSSASARVTRCSLPSSSAYADAVSLCPSWPTGIFPALASTWT